MTIFTTSTRDELIGDGVQTVFDFTPDLIKTFDLRVVVDGVQKTEVTDYRVDLALKKVTFTRPPPAPITPGTANVLLYRDIVPIRSVDYQQLGEAKASAFNEDFDRIWMELQELATSLRFKFGIDQLTTGITRLDIPGGPSEGGKAIRWNVPGTQLETFTITTGSVPQSSTAQQGTVELATDAEVNAGTDTERAITPSGLSSRTATTSMTGLVEKATQTETNQGTPDKYPSAAEIAGRSLMGRRNLLMNGGFDVWQRGTSFALSRSATMTADRWRAFLNGTIGTAEISRVENGQIARAAVQALTGRAPTYQLRWSQTVAGSGQSAKLLSQRIENLRQFQSMKLRVSFVAQTISGTADCGCLLVYNLGTGGSPSAQGGRATQPFTVTTTWQRFGFTFDVPDFASETFGTDGPHTRNLELRISLPLNATHDLRFCDFQVEPGEATTRFERRRFGEELRDCQRYYWKRFPYDVAPAQNAGTTDSITWRSTAGPSVSTWSPQGHHPEMMRVMPTVTTYNTNAANAQVRNTTDNADCSATVVPVSQRYFIISCTTSAGTAVNEQLQVHATFDAEF